MYWFWYPRKTGDPIVFLRTRYQISTNFNLTKRRRSPNMRYDIPHIQMADLL